MFSRARRSALTLVLLAAVMALSACSSRPPRPAPVEDRPVGAARPAPVTTAAPAQPRPVSGPTPAVAPTAPIPPATYVVKPGDTMIRIGLETGHGWRDLARWNNLENPNQIEVGQVLRLVPPATVIEGVAGTRPATSQAAPGAVATPIASPSVVASPVTTSSAVASTVPPAGTVTAARPSVAAAPVAAPATDSAEENIAWIWPSGGPLLAGFDEVKNKGLDIGGKPGDPVLAVADGRVVYAGAGLRGYGNLIILKHNNLYLTAYAHNQALLVKEDQSVSKGQRIAEMGSSDADRVKLHFEIRRQGKPVDPAKYLPPR